MKTITLTDEQFDTLFEYVDNKVTTIVDASVDYQDSQILEDFEDFIDLLTDLGWDYQSMTTSGRETYDKLMQMLGVIEPDEVYMEI